MTRKPTVLRFLRLVMVALSLVLPLAAAAGQRVAVGAYPFLPFVGKSGGLTQELIEAMNRFQSDYEFYLVDTSSNRRYRDMAQGTFQVIFFENIKWGWDPAQVDASNVFLRGDGEVYVARSAPGRGQDYFTSLHDKHILGVTGYHYAFADFETDAARLGQRFHITNSADNEVSLRNLLAGRGDVAVITRSYLKAYLLRNPQDAPALLVSERLDQAYAHTALVRRGGKPSVQEIDQLMERMRAAGALQKLWARYGL